MSEELTLFDLPSKPPCQTWSVHPWKTRLLLNFKGIDYKTQWILQKQLKISKHRRPYKKALMISKRFSSVTAHEVGWPYTIPTVKFPDGKYLMDSRKIADRIEELYPLPSANLESPFLPRMEELINPLIFTVFGLVIKEIPDNLLNESSEEYWNDDRADLVGMDIDKFAELKGGQNALDAARENLEKITALYKEKAEEPFLEGDTPIYADFLWVSFLEFIRVSNPAWFGGFLETTGDVALHEKILTASSPYLKRNSY